MVRPIDGVASIQAPLRLQEQLHNAQRQAQIPHEAQERDAVKTQAQLSERVQAEEKALGDAIREDDPRRGRNRQQHEQDDEDDDQPQDGLPHVDLVA